MDAFGAAAAALQFAVALLKSAQTLDAVLNGKSSEPVVTMKKLAQISEGECDAFLSRFSDDSTPTVKDARIIAQQGKDVCGTLFKKIAKMHPDKRNLKRLARALGTIMWSKGELLELQRSLSDCMQALGRFLAQQDRATVDAALKDAEKALESQINVRSDEILALHIKTSAQSDDRWSQVIQLANAANEKRSAQKKAKLLLDALDFPGMGQRYIEVSAADESTFRWIFKRHENSSVDDRFSQWLTSGNGVFHIMGKPGSGKSTLMKYVFENPATTKMLEQWANGKTLLQAACFFWKPGAVLQKTMMGLVRTLLHGIMVASHDVAKTLFPDIWDTVGIEEKVKISLSDAAMQKAFQHLVDGEAQSAGADLCCCFFIDGLDEYGDANNTIIQLVRQLTRMAQNGTGWLKICASSREYPEITEKLAADEAHRLALQDLTRGDITALVDRRLQKTFPDDDVLKDKDLHMLRHTIINEAEGVFLWVVLVLGIIDEEAELGTSVRELQDFVHAQHDDLDAFFETVVARIEKRNRQKAAILFQYTLRVATLGTTSDGIAANSLLWYMFLVEHPTAEDSGDQDAVLAQYEKVQQRLQTDGALGLTLSKTAKRVKRYGAGLLTTTEEQSSRFLGEPPPQYHPGWAVRLTHRSIHEFLATLLATQWKDAVCGFDAVGAYVRMLNAFQAPVGWNVSLLVQLVLYFRLQVLAGPDCLGTERLHRNFQLIDAYSAREEEAYELKNPSRMPLAVDLAARLLCYEYLEWRRHKPHAQQELKGKHWAYHVRAFLDYEFFREDCGNNRLLPTIAQLLASGASVSGIEKTVEGSWPDNRYYFNSPWMAVIRALVGACENRSWGRADGRPDLVPFLDLAEFSEVVALFIQASDGADGMLPTWVWLDEETVLIVMDGHDLAEKEQHVVRRLVWQQKTPVPLTFPRPAGEAMPGTVSLAEVLLGMGVPGNAATLAAAREPAATRALRAKQLLSAESLAHLRTNSEKSKRVHHHPSQSFLLL